jgi:hypothetical protein
MSRSKYLKGECQHCNGHLEFLADHIGMVVPCPHCGQETELLLVQPREDSAVPRRAIIWTGIAVLILGLGLAGAVMALKRAQRWAETQKLQATAQAAPDKQPNVDSQLEQTNSVIQDDLGVSAVSIEKAPGTSLQYAVGTVTNTSNHQRFGLKVRLDLSNGTGQKIGVASDYRPVLEPGAEWQFKALVVDPKTIAAKVASILEDQ